MLPPFFRVLPGVVACLCLSAAVPLAARPLLPVPDDDWVVIAGNPDLGEFQHPDQEPLDFAIWQAGDGSWQLWSCIRHTAHPGRTRVFHRWQGGALEEPDWEPMGITFRGDGTVGETIGGMQAPHVIRHEGRWWMFYGGYWSKMSNSSDSLPAGR